MNIARLPFLSIVLLTPPHLQQAPWLLGGDFARERLGNLPGRSRDLSLPPTVCCPILLIACASFPPVHMGWMLGLSSVTGFGLGAFGAAAPFKVLVGRMGWRAATMVSAALPAAVCVVILPAACRCRYKKKEEEVCVDINTRGGAVVGV
ncbi:hypothetical protein T492DRAFT_501441 [Pavlovales sp. CCMP2436]|nr:hypothetical protein T492DRAFT_501441 [Pavlovales sp. CCMP2436]